MITYRHDGLNPFKITVKIEGRVAGHILREDGMYFYRSKGALSSMYGERMATVDAVKRSLEA